MVGYLQTEDYIAKVYRFPTWKISQYFGHSSAGQIVCGKSRDFSFKRAIGRLVVTCQVWWHNSLSANSNVTRSNFLKLLSECNTYWMISINSLCRLWKQKLKETEEKQDPSTFLQQWHGSISFHRIGICCSNVDNCCREPVSDNYRAELMCVLVFLLSKDWYMYVYVCMCVCVSVCMQQGRLVPRSFMRSATKRHILALLSKLEPWYTGRTNNNQLVRGKDQTIRRSRRMKVL